MNEQEEIIEIKTNLKEAIEVYQAMLEANPYDCDYYHKKLYELGWDSEMWNILKAELTATTRD